MSSADLNTLKQRLREFAEARDWGQFHFLENLQQNKLDEVETELADKLDINLLAAAKRTRIVPVVLIGRAF